MRYTRTLQIGLFFITVFLYLGFSWSTVLGDFGGDNANYLLMARHYSFYSPTSAVADYFTAQSFYPPLFPLLLSLTGGGESLLAAHLATTSFLLGACLLFYWWLRKNYLGRLAATVACLALMSVPGLYLQTLSIHSENLFLLCTFATLGIVAAAQINSDSKWLWLAITTMAAAYLTRGAGIALIGAWLGWVWVNRLPQRWTLSAAAFLPVIIWKLFGNAGASDYWHQFVNGYSSISVFFDQIESQSRYLLNGWLYNFGYGYVSDLAGKVLLIAGMVALLWRAWLRKLDGLYGLAYILMILLWPFPAEAQRMTIVILPVMLGQAVWMLGKWQLEGRTIRPLQIMLFSILFMAFLPELALNAQRYYSPLPPSIPQAYRHTENWYVPDFRDAQTNVSFYAGLENSYKQLANDIPEGECVFSIKPSIAAYLSGRISKAPPSPKVDDSVFIAELKQLDCRYFYLMPIISPTYPVFLYPYHRLEGQLEIMDGDKVAVPGTQLETHGILARLKKVP